MPTKSYDVIWASITPRRAELLGLLAEGYTESECARLMGISRDGARSAIAVLRDLTEIPTQRDLGRWWKLNREGWLAWLRELSGAA